MSILRLWTVQVPVDEPQPNYWQMVGFTCFSCAPLIITNGNEEQSYHNRGNGCTKLELLFLIGEMNLMM